MSMEIGIFGKYGSGEYVKRIKSYGLELIEEGTFDSSVVWVESPEWVVAGGVATYDDSNTDRIYQLHAGILQLLKVYRVSFDLGGVPGGKDIGFLSWNGVAYLFGEFTHGLLDNGSYVMELTSWGNHDSFAIYGYVAGLAFTVDNFSVKEIIWLNIEEDE